MNFLITLLTIGWLMFLMLITGWNIQLYDIPYICKRLNRVLGEKLMKRFSPWGLVTEGETYSRTKAHNI
jgi:hypothetical protein